MLFDVIGVDYLCYMVFWFQLFVVFYSVVYFCDYCWLFLWVWFLEGEVVDSFFFIWKVVNYLECEVYDLFGIEFIGYFDFCKVLMFDDFEGYLLCKDFLLGEMLMLFCEGCFFDFVVFCVGLSGQQCGLIGYWGEMCWGEWCWEDIVLLLLLEGGLK